MCCTSIPESYESTAFLTPFITPVINVESTELFCQPLFLNQKKNQPMINEDLKGRLECM